MRSELLNVKYILLGVAALGIVGIATFLYTTQLQGDGTIDATGWEVYQNDDHTPYEIRYPEGAEIAEGAAGVRIDLPFAGGTTLAEKYLQIEYAVPNAQGACKRPSLGQVVSAETVSINGVNFQYEIGVEDAAGFFFEYNGYYVKKGNMCYVLKFVLRSMPQEPGEGDLEAFTREQHIEMFEAMLHTFRFTN